MGKYRVNAYAQHLSVFSLEAFTIGFEVGQFLLSAAGKIKRIKGNDDIFFPDKILEPDFLVP